MHEPYNGYSWQQRARILGEKKRLATIGDTTSLAYLNSGAPCAICADPGEEEPPGQWHSEDYSAPFLLAPPATYIVCNTCHTRLHKRFPGSVDKPTDWVLFVLFLSSGGYGREFTQRYSSKKRQQMLATLSQGGEVSFPQVRSRDTIETQWWQQLSVDPESKIAAWARPRPLRPRPSIEDFRSALMQIAPTETELAFLRVHANAPQRRLTMRDAAMAVYQRPLPVLANRCYGALARRLATATGWSPDKRSDGSPVWMSTVAEGWQPAGSEFEWILVPQLLALFREK